MRTGPTRVIGVAFTLVTLAPTAASAHIGNGDGHGFLHGFVHPLGGADHVLAMVAVGLLAWQLGGRALWLLPATFLAVMAAGGMLAFAGAAMPGVELGVGASVIVLGALVALGMKAPVAAAAIAGMFAIFHGHAHASELPESAAAAAYATGFLAATALLHIGGVRLGALLDRMGEASGLALHRLGGAGMVVAGVALLGRII